MATSVRVSGVIQIIGINPYVLVSVKEAKLLKPAWHKPMPVIISINGDHEHQWRTNMMPTGRGSFYLYLHGEMRQASKTGVGDKVTINIVFDEEYRNGPQHPMPAWFEAALRADAEASANWEKLSLSRQKEVLRYFSHLKSDAARLRNLERVMKSLGGKATHFMGRDWIGGK